MVVAMPTTISDAFMAANLPHGGVVRWGQEPPTAASGVYVVSLTRSVGTCDQKLEEPPLASAKFESWLQVCPRLTLDGEPPTVTQLMDRVRRFWLRDEVILYIGLAASLSKRLGNYYRTSIGARGPHSGGYFLKLLSNLDELWVHYALSLEPISSEQELLRRFFDNVSDDAKQALFDPDRPLPFANLEWPPGMRKSHGLGGARKSRHSSTRRDVNQPLIDTSFNMHTASKYHTLINILDQIRGEAAMTPYLALYLPDKSLGEAINQARARAFIHLYLKVSFGLLDFSEREALITDGRSDGGIDGYFIDKESRTIHFLQAKYRVNAGNFESKTITTTELLVMDISRILDGEPVDERGTDYNSGIREMQRSISNIDDIGRYKYRVTILANVPDIPNSKLMQLTGGYRTDVVNYERAYRDLVFPVISGTYFRAKDLQIAIDLSNKNAGTKISYEVSTEHHDCEITVLFVPTLEIARIMHRYKNSILQFNPRSYLELEGHIVNASIRDTIVGTTTNEFALFNNGITMLSDETNINEKIGQRNKAQLTLKNPQIINGGQTAYTLSRILEEAINNNRDAPFQGKEVLLKVITLIEARGQAVSTQERIQLIDKISTASNQQTPVINADKFSNDEDHVKIQSVLFDRYGVLYERKRGEFADGLHQGYITRDLLVERNLFFRLYYAVLGDFTKAVQKRLFVRIENPLQTVSDTGLLDRLYFAFLCYKGLERGAPHIHKVARSRNLYLRIYALASKSPDQLEDYPRAADEAVSSLGNDWKTFTALAASRRREFWQLKTNRKTGLPANVFDRNRWVSSGMFAADVAEFFGAKIDMTDALKADVVIRNDDID
jgi:hypothetical protein